MQKIIISDTSCLILLDKIHRLEILRDVFGTLTVTQEISNEYGKRLPEWIEVNNPINVNYQKILEASVDRGEASAIALALEQSECLLILDDIKARKYAENLGLEITDTLGVIVSAKQAGKIDSVKSILDSMRQTDFRLTDKLEQEILKRAGEK